MLQVGLLLREAFCIGIFKCTGIASLVSACLCEHTLAFLFRAIWH